MKIACVGYLHGAGGAERQITMLANALAEDANNEVSLIILANFDDRYFISKKVHVIDLTGAEEWKGNKIFNRFRIFRRTILELEPDITIHYWLQSVYFSLGIPNDRKGKVIYSERGDPGDDEYKGILGVVRKVAFRKVDGFVFQSEGARDYFDRNIVNRSIVIHNPVSVPKGKYTPVKNRKKTIITVGRLHPQKNQKLLISAFSKIAPKYIDYNLEIYGEGDLLDDLQNQILIYGLNDRIKIYPPTKDIFDRINESALFVLSSDFEGMPNVLMEAMALGVPCISTDCKPGGARTLIENGINGIITPVGDSVALAKSISWLLDNEFLANEMAKNATMILETHSPELIYDKWKKYINNICG